jgi:hypothetical protein
MALRETADRSLPSLVNGGGHTLNPSSRPRVRSWFDLYPDELAAHNVIADGEDTGLAICLGHDVRQVVMSASKYANPSVIHQQAPGIGHHGAEPRPCADAQCLRTGSGPFRIGRQDLHRVGRGGDGR